MMHPSATHQNMLRKCIEHTTGAVLELGCGEHSTPFIAQLLGSSRYLSLSGRFHVKMDNDERWARRFEAIHCPDWKVLIDGIGAGGERFSVALVDCGPCSSRGSLVQGIRSHVDYIVCHDTETVWARAYGWRHVKPFRHEYVDKSQTPWTTVWSELDLGFLHAG